MDYQKEFEKENCSKCDNHINGFCIAENTLKHYSEYLEEKLKSDNSEYAKCEECNINKPNICHECAVENKWQIG